MLGHQQSVLETVSLVFLVICCSNGIRRGENFCLRCLTNLLNSSACREKVVWSGNSVPFGSEFARAIMYSTCGSWTLYPCGVATRAATDVGLGTPTGLVVPRSLWDQSRRSLASSTFGCDSSRTSSKTCASDARSDGVCDGTNRSVKDRASS